MTVLENLMLGRHARMSHSVFAGGIYWGLAQKRELADREVIEDVIDFLEIQHVRNSVVGPLAYGIQKRVEFGRALALDPKLLILDECMAGMNLEEKEDMARFILDANEELDKTVVLIEHDMGFVMDISDRIIVLNQGEKIAEGTPDEVKKTPIVIKAYLGSAFAEQVASSAS
jgi:branched-chain amino acid transport system ATP-binding protein